jgi:two-component system chemotaxis response regulator CheY
MDDPFKDIDFTEIDRLLSVVKGEKPKKRFDGVPTILIVEDSKIQIQRTLKMLESAGFRDNIVSENGAEALNILIERDDIDVALVDWVLPVMDGIQLLQKMRTDPSVSKPPVIMVTSKASQEDIVKAAKSGARDYLVKPFAAELLIEKIKKLVKC